MTLMQGHNKTDRLMIDEGAAMTYPSARDLKLNEAYTLSKSLVIVAIMIYCNL